MNDQAKKVFEDLCEKGMKPWSALPPHGRARVINRVLPKPSEDWNKIRDGIIHRAEERAARANRLLDQIKTQLSNAERYAGLVVKFPDHPAVRLRYREELDRKTVNLRLSLQELYRSGSLVDTTVIRTLEAKLGNTLVMPMRERELAKPKSNAAQVYRDLCGISDDLESRGGTLLVPVRGVGDFEYQVSGTPYSMFIDHQSVYSIEPAVVVESDLHTDDGEIELRLPLAGHILKMGLAGGTTDTVRCVPLTDTECKHGYPYGHIRDNQGSLCTSEAAAPAAMGVRLSMFSIIRAAILTIVNEPKGGLNDGYNICACANAEYLCKKCGGWHRVGKFARRMRPVMPCEMALVVCPCCNDQYDPDSNLDAVRSVDGKHMHRCCVEVCPYSDMACTRDQLIHDELCPALPPIHPASPSVRCSYTGIRCVPMLPGRGWTQLREKLTDTGLIARLAIEMADGSWCWTGFLPSIPGWADKVGDKYAAVVVRGVPGANLILDDSQDLYAERIRNMFSYGVDRKGPMGQYTLGSDGVISADMRLIRFPYRDAMKQIVGSMWIFSTKGFQRHVCLNPLVDPGTPGTYSPDLDMDNAMLARFLAHGCLDNGNKASDLSWPAMAIAVTDAPHLAPVGITVIEDVPVPAERPVWHPDDEEDHDDDDDEDPVFEDEDHDDDDDDDHYEENT